MASVGYQKEAQEGSLNSTMIQCTITIRACIHDKSTLYNMKLDPTNWIRQDVVQDIVLYERERTVK